MYLTNLHLPFEGWITLFTLQFALFEGWITLLEEWMGFRNKDSTFKKDECIHPWGWITLLVGWINRLMSMFYHLFKLYGFTRFAFTLQRVIHPSFTLFENPFTLQKGRIEGWKGWFTLRRFNEGSSNTV